MRNEAKGDIRTKSPFWIRLKQDLRSSRMLFALMMFMQLAGVPLYLLLNLAAESCLRNTGDIDRHSELRAVALIPMLVFAAAVLLGFDIVLIRFRYYYRKEESDKVLALPVNTDQRFMADLLSGLIVYTVPYFAAVLLSAVILAAGQMNEGLTELMLKDIAGYDFNIGYLPEIFIMMASCALMIMIMYYVFCVFSSVCCGKISETVVFAVLFAAVQPAFFNVICSMIFDNAPGVEYEDFGYLGMAGPVGALLEGYELAALISWGHDDILPTFIRSIVSCTLVILLLTVMSFLLNRKRKAEDAGKSFVFSVFYYIVLFIIVFCISGLIVNQGMTAAGLFTALVAFLIIEVVKNRGIPGVLKFLRSAIVFFAAAVMSVSFVKLSESTEGFGVGRTVPDVKDVSHVNICMYFGEKLHAETGSWYLDVTFSDEERVIDLAVRTNRILMEYTGDNGNSEDRVYNEHSEGFAIVYYMKNGCKISRYYSVPEGTFPELEAEYLKYRENKYGEETLKLILEMSREEG